MAYGHQTFKKKKKKKKKKILHILILRIDTYFIFNCKSLHRSEVTIKLRSGSGILPMDPTRVAYPDPDPTWIRFESGQLIRIQEAKLTHKSRKKFGNFLFEVLDVPFES